MAGPAPDNLVLIGYRGCGKTTVGRLLAQQLGRTFLDTDELIEAAGDASITEIFATHGEPAFRQRERDIIARVVGCRNQVVAVGGGAVIDPSNVERLRGAAQVIWLAASPETLWQRISADVATPKTRPNLTPTGGLEEVRKLLAERDRAYRSAAHFVVSTDDRSPQEVVAAIVERLVTIQSQASVGAG